MTDRLQEAADLIIESSGAIETALGCADEGADYYEPLVVFAKALDATNRALIAVISETHGKRPR